jgi:cytochrome c oxidase assembly protein subunit 15
VPKRRTARSNEGVSAPILDRDFDRHRLVDLESDGNHDGENDESEQWLLHVAIIPAAVPAVPGVVDCAAGREAGTLRVVETLTRRRSRFRLLAWSVLAFNVLVILGGSIVRATESGDGCGASWPICTDRIFPSNPAVETVIEFGHRLTSALAILGVVALYVMARRLFEHGHRVRRAAGATVILMGIESLLGAGLVIFGWVAQDESIARMIVVPLHLTNTYLLLGALTLTAWWGSGNPGPRSPGDPPVDRRLARGASGLLVVGAMGALNALSDTLYPVDSFVSGLRQELSSEAPWLVQIRVIHPVVAIAVGFGVAYLVMRLSAKAVDRTKRMAGIIMGLVALQVFAGLVNVMLATPLETQIVHLAIADAMWIAYVVFSAALVGDRVGTDQSGGKVA